MAEAHRDTIETKQSPIRWSTLLNPVDLGLIVVVPLVLIGVFLLPIETREQFVFTISEPTIITAYTSYYVHLDQAHLLGNLVMYGLVAPAVYTLSVLSDKRWLFRRGFATILLAFPFALTGTQIGFPRDRVLFGFSGINAAFFGLLCFVIISYASIHLSTTVKERDAPVLLFSTVAIIAALSVRTQEWMAEIAAISIGIGLIYVVGLMIRSGIPNLQTIIRQWSGGRAEIGIIGLGVLLLFPFLAFPQSVTQDETVFDVYVHLLGYCISFIMMYIAAIVIE